MTLPYMKLATNNLYNVMSDPLGARCVYCLGKPVITLATDVTDECTIICPLCGIDAVVPASRVQSEHVLKEWRRLGFE